ncbi:CheR family methyltransferase [Pseudomonas vanderleydeniana]|uniref:Chemotaxis protein methyltransferase n=1 Tax=Pseudomonas vanderleydeniana TaxID=2745495 RepID=A0A9E6PQR3_9PSED|nr:protein-glutamate O-methyltransferase CheR [Pseudomonas vanderleydeniana]QXI31164.1 protein-glutamate O-methyltransferase CheR [Pseudomonas vanderleydeniana]
MTELSLSNSELQQFRAMIHEIAGIAMSEAKRQLIAGRLSKRLRHFGLGSYGDYYQLLMKDKGEMQMAIDLLTTNETYFFREPKHFEFLREKLVTELRGSGPLRIWSAACSSGEEPYTLALLLASTLQGRPWEILASDISTRILDKARAGLYPLDAAQGIPGDLRQRFCLQGTGRNEGLFTLDASLRQRVQFRQINLNSTLPDVGMFDVIFLRNVMIYFDADTKRQVVQRLRARLRPGGYFLVSHSESLHGITDELESVRPSVYRRPHA